MAVREGDISRQEGDFIDYPRKSNCFEILPSGLYLMTQTPLPGAEGASTGTIIVCTFNTNVKSTIVNSGSFYLQDSGWNLVSATYTVSGNVIQLLPSSILQPNEFYTVTLTTNLQTTSGGNLSRTTKWNFSTGIGLETGHQYNSILVDGALLDWNAANNVTYNALLFENIADDSDASWGETDELWATWDTNYLYIGIRKAVASGDEWYDYIAIDVTRDNQGAADNPVSVHAFTYTSNRRPEYLLRYNHDAIFSPTYENDWRIYDWSSSTWNQNTIINTNRGDNKNEIVEVRIPWSTFGNVPNRISLCAYSYYSNKIKDFCPENISGSTNWITIDPDNNGDEIADGAAPPSYMPDINITKAATNASLSSKMIGAANVLPGMTVYYEIAWTNRGNIVLTNVIIYDKIPLGSVYAGSSLTNEVVIGSSTWTKEYSENDPTIQTYNSIGYSGVEPTPASDARWVRTKTPDLLPGESGFMSFKVIVGNSDAGTLMPNAAYVTCRQSLALGSDIYNITIATQYGGSFSSVSDMTGAAVILDGTNYFDIYFTNQGNSMLDFPLTMPYLVSPFCLLGYWDIAFVKNDVVISSINNLAKGGIFNFQVRVVTTNSLLGTGDRIDFRIRAQAGGNTSATNYEGDDGAAYGGVIGEDWNGIIDDAVYGGFIFQQGNPIITLKLPGAPPAAPILEIVKSVSNITIAGIPITGPAPGATITYILNYSNAGDSSAINAVIYDGIPAGTKFKSMTNSPSTTGWTNQYSEDTGAIDQSYGSANYAGTYTAKTDVTWVRWIKLSVAEGEKGRLIYQAIIK